MQEKCSSSRMNLRLVPMEKLNLFLWSQRSRRGITIFLKTLKTTLFLNLRRWSIRISRTPKDTEFLNSLSIQDIISIMKWKIMMIVLMMRTSLNLNNLNNLISESQERTIITTNMKERVNLRRKSNSSIATNNTNNSSIVKTVINLLWVYLRGRMSDKISRITWISSTKSNNSIKTTILQTKMIINTRIITTADIINNSNKMERKFKDISNRTIAMILKRS